MEIDPRGPRFGAAITVVVLAVVLITGNVWLLAAQTVVFAVGALAGLRHAPYGLLYRWLIRPRLGPPGHTEAEARPRAALFSPRSRWSRRSSTPSSISAWAAICIFSSSVKRSGRPLRTCPEKEVYPP
jgi:hypothetical protein